MTPKDIVEQLVVEKFQALAALKQAQAQVEELTAKIKALQADAAKERA